MVQTNSRESQPFFVRVQRSRSRSACGVSFPSYFCRVGGRVFTEEVGAGISFVGLLLYLGEPFV